ncbi:carbamate kinase [Micractinium conductrix]|uniref:Carbamate kinase n=1 Tax=Micractinium conductrix TaxID=554055 RepID=A0A2P6VF90_9CHLO|nr:carbamate kinase [Micractinium conductrix]|eukprot:PSC72748.1 carbamate kinase [Micractinium conductrix]
MDTQMHNAREAATAVKQLVGAGFRVCVTHGNGPQVGMLALQEPSARLEVLDAETEGQLGFILELELGNALPQQQVAALLTQVVVDPADPAFSNPTKQVGPHYSKEEAERLAEEKGWAVASDGDSFRRVVASPLPKEVVEWRAVQTLLQAGVITVCCGGGGIPVAVDGAGEKYGVEAVVDKDEASALLGTRLHADWLLMLTDADGIYDPAGWPHQKLLLPSPVRCSELAGMRFASGSMAPKVAAACRFVQATGGSAAVGRIADALRIVQGGAGTVITAG